jgi:hypothetical protein
LTARPPIGPAALQQRGNRLDLGVVVQDFVAHLAAPARLLVAAERKRGIEDVVAVDPDCAGPELLGEGVRLGDVPGPDAGSQERRASEVAAELGFDSIVEFIDLSRAQGLTWQQMAATSGQPEAWLRRHAGCAADALPGENPST